MGGVNQIRLIKNLIIVNFIKPSLYIKDISVLSFLSDIMDEL